MTTAADTFENFMKALEACADISASKLACPTYMTIATPNAGDILREIRTAMATRRNPALTDGIRLKYDGTFMYEPAAANRVVGIPSWLNELLSNECSPVRTMLDGLQPGGAVSVEISVTVDKPREPVKKSSVAKRDLGRSDHGTLKLHGRLI